METLALFESWSRLARTARVPRCGCWGPDARLSATPAFAPQNARRVTMMSLDVPSPSAHQRGPSALMAGVLWTVRPSSVPPAPGRGRQSGLWVLPRPAGQEQKGLGLSGTCARGCCPAVSRFLPHRCLCAKKGEVTAFAAFLTFVPLEKSQC